MSNKEKKSLKELAWDVTEEEYRADPAFSYSTLSRFQREGFRKLDSLFDRISTPSLTFGSMVDTLITDSQQAFSDKFMVCQFLELSDSLKAITQSLFELRDENGNRYSSLDKFDDGTISAMAVANSYYTADKYASYRVKSVREKCSYYYDLLMMSEGKHVVSQEDYNDAMACASELKSNPVTKEYFSANPFDTDKEYLFQTKFKFEYEGIRYRVMPDLLVVNHKDKTIIPVDLKTTGHPEEEFQESFYKWRYMIQAQLYTACLQSVIKDDPYFEDFKICDYEFAVINRKTLAPLVWVYPDNFSNIETVTPEGEVIPNWRELGKTLKIYLDRKEKEGTVKYSEEMLDWGCKPVIKSCFNLK